MRTCVIMTMKALMALFAFSLLAVSMAAQAAAVGIVWTTETEMVNELAPHCIEYGVYNPSADDAMVQLSVSDSLKPVTQGAYSHTQLVAGSTKHDNAVMVQLCFQVPRVYEADCLAGDFLCEQSCTQDEVVYEGEVMALELKEAQGGGIGSQTTVGASVPLKLRVKCNPYGRDWSPVYLGVAAVAVVGIAGYMKKGKKSKAKVQKQEAPAKKPAAKKKKKKSK